MGKLVYKGNQTKEISFPLGGIGSGCIGLSGNGSLIDWEIFNRPSKGSRNGFSFFAIKAESGDQVMDARVLQGDLQPPYTGIYGLSYSGFGFGSDRTTMAGVPHFKDTEFVGEFPLAKVELLDDTFPGQASLTAFNPFIPLNDKDSSIPGAFFEWSVENTTQQELNYTVCFVLNNPLPEKGVNRYTHSENIHRINLASEQYQKSDVEYGEITLATDAAEVSYQEYWYRGTWFDGLTVFWKDFITPGRFKNRAYPAPGKNDSSTLAVHFTLKPGETKKVKFITTWNFPNMHNYWHPEKCSSGECETKPVKSWKNYYATLFESSVESSVYALKQWDRLYAQTRQFKDSLFSSTLPLEVIDAVSANISILKSPTCLRLEDGSFYAFEGCSSKEGSCEGSCTHVWNYAYALPFLFPKLERSMRDLDFKYNQREDGGMAFRLQLPLGRERSGFRPCADGQFGGVIKTYREWKLSGNTEWLKSNWEAVKKSIDYAWAETNKDQWDIDKDGVLDGRQHHTLDMELFGANSWLTGFYLAALKAGAEMAEFLGEHEKAQEYSAVFEKGRAWVDGHLFNGEYYYQKINLKDMAIVEKYDQGSDIMYSGMHSAVEAYWDAESGEIKYQIGEGCGIDQVLAQWHADICGLGDIFDRNQTNSALAAIYRHNYKKSLRNWFNPCRLYGVNDEAGAVICTWPEGTSKPTIPAPYTEETWSGCEYQAASHMIRRGLVDEGLEIVRAVRDRYDGEKRNPWNEIECGSNYARSMASYDLLLAFSGFEFDMVTGMIGFNPVRLTENQFKSFWSVDSGWGTAHFTPESFTLKLSLGSLQIKKLKLPGLSEKAITAIRVGEKDIPFSVNEDFIEFKNDVNLDTDASLVIDMTL